MEAGPLPRTSPRKLAALGRLLDVIDALRGPGGCPWDRAQTLQDMKRYLLEETCEAVDAIDEAQGRPEATVCEELGDVLMNVVLAARIAEDERGFDVADVASGISEKLVRRHPHVFGDRRVDTVDEVLTTWNAIKETEKREAAGPTTQPTRAPAGSAAWTSRLARVPRSLPALERAAQMGRVAATAGFDWPDAAGAFDKVVEETEEVRVLLAEVAGGPPDSASVDSASVDSASVDSASVDSASVDSGPAGSSAPEEPRHDAPRDHLEAELGDLLFAVTNLCRKLEIAPEEALRRTLRKFCDRFRAIEERFPDLKGVSLSEMERVWQEAKGRGAAGEAIG